MKQYIVKVYEDRTEWYNEKDQLHRVNGPAIKFADGTRFWYRNGQWHREDGPAIDLANGDKSWFRNGQRHREDGPACEYANGSKFWYLDGKLLTEAEHKQQTNKSPDCNGKVVEIDGKKYELKLVS